MSTSQQTSEQTDIRSRIRAAITHMDHVLPSQAPIQDFVHHNTLHGYEHLPFTEALTEVRKLTGVSGYLPAEKFREYYSEGRITDADLDQSLAEDSSLNSNHVFLNTEGLTITRADILKTVMLQPLEPVTASQLNWHIEEQAALERIRSGVSEKSKTQLRQRAARVGQQTEAGAVSDLWSACLETLGLEHYFLHPEELLDLSPEQAEQMLLRIATKVEQDDEALLIHIKLRKQASKELDQLLDQVGDQLTLRQLLLKLTGDDILNDIRPTLIRHLGAYLDQGIASWHSADREQGFYPSWRRLAMHDPVWLFEDMADWKEELYVLPDDPLETIVSELMRMDLPESRWTRYLEKLALELPGWSGMVLWRQNHPHYQNLIPEQVNMLDYLAVRLVLERMYAQRLCRQYWQLEASLDILRWYFRRHRSEFFVRYSLYNSRLPEYLVHLAQRQVRDYHPAHDSYHGWPPLADMIWTWQHSPSADHHGEYTVYRGGWRLFLLAQHLGLCGTDIRRLDAQQLTTCLDLMDFDQDKLGYLWLRAYENHYHQKILNALANNHGRGRWRTRDQRPEAQVIFCMDEREEAIRRHLEEKNPGIETLGAAGFFGVAINWQGLDDTRVTPLCPIVVTPSHTIREHAGQSQMALKQKHDRRRKLRLLIKNGLHHEIRRNLISSAVYIIVSAPLALLTLTGKVMLPRITGGLIKALRKGFDVTVPTQLTINSVSSIVATPEQPRLGFTDQEQVDRVAGFLRTIGLASGFGPLVVLMGHGSASENNPHLAAYDCGACSGRHGGPNARTFATLANRPEIRTQLQQKDIHIPTDTWFLGAEHNTCDESIVWYDTDVLPAELSDAFASLKSDLHHACQASAHERCRRLASAPVNPSLKQAYQHVIGRARDISQARPELGHVTNATAYIGRRANTQGAFFDRRMFLISYDPTIDADGKIVESILMAVGPVGAGINLEYYFSTIDNDNHGCGTKVVHNVTGMFGVMEGASSDLRTGLPKQMTEIHEAMRLLVIVEAQPETLTTICQRQPELQRLIGNGWILVATMSPGTGALSVFTADKGFVPWRQPKTALPEVAHSRDWYNRHSGPLAPVLIRQEASHG